MTGADRDVLKPERFANSHSILKTGSRTKAHYSSRPDWEYRYQTRYAMLAKATTLAPSRSPRVILRSRTQLITHHPVSRQTSYHPFHPLHLRPIFNQAVSKLQLPTLSNSLSPFAKSHPTISRF